MAVAPWLTPWPTQGLTELIRQRVLSGELAFMGSSAGTNAAGQSLHVSICMPICAPPSFDAIGVVPFLVSPHYHDAENKAKLAENGMARRISRQRALSSPSPLRIQLAVVSTRPCGNGCRPDLETPSDASVCLYHTPFPTTPCQNPV